MRTQDLSAILRTVDTYEAMQMPQASNEHILLFMLPPKEGHQSK